MLKKKKRKNVDYKVGTLYHISVCLLFTSPLTDDKVPAF
jgi:hypothetical protein